MIRDGGVEENEKRTESATRAFSRAVRGRSKSSVSWKTRHHLPANLIKLRCAIWNQMPHHSATARYSIEMLVSFRLRCGGQLFEMSWQSSGRGTASETSCSADSGVHAVRIAQFFDQTPSEQRKLEMLSMRRIAGGDEFQAFSIGQLHLTC